MKKLYEWNEVITVYPEEIWTDADGNTMTRASSEGVETPAMIRLRSSDGVSAEENTQGFYTDEVYWCRFPRGSAGDALVWEGRVGPQSRVEWNGEDWRMFGQPRWFNGSSRTRRFEFSIRRN